jgi:hypothetical protein
MVSCWQTGRGVGAGVRVGSAVDPESVEDTQALTITTRHTAGNHSFGHFIAHPPAIPRHPRLLPEAHAPHFGQPRAGIDGIPLPTHPFLVDNLQIVFNVIQIAAVSVAILVEILRDTTACAALGIHRLHVPSGAVVPGVVACGGTGGDLGVPLRVELEAAG